MPVKTTFREASGGEAMIPGGPERTSIVRRQRSLLR
jgi:hypothetical protein